MQRELRVMTGELSRLQAQEADAKCRIGAAKTQAAAIAGL
jgi:hypothetical protein